VKGGAAAGVERIPSSVSDSDFDMLDGVLLNEV